VCGVPLNRVTLFVLFFSVSQIDMVIINALPLVRHFVKNLVDKIVKVDGKLR
jgi:hypothetical protein